MTVSQLDSNSRLPANRTHRKILMLYCDKRLHLYSWSLNTSFWTLFTLESWNDKIITYHSHRFIVTGVCSIPGNNSRTTKSIERSCAWAMERFKWILGNYSLFYVLNYHFTFWLYDLRRFCVNFIRALVKLTEPNEGKIKYRRRGGKVGWAISWRSTGR